MSEARKVHPTVAIAAGLAAGAFGPRVWSQPPGSSPTESSAAAGGALEEIVVTARRRAERAQDVPIAMSVVPGDTLIEARADSLGRLQQLVPSMYLFGYNPRTTSIAIRGLGGNAGLASDGLENGVGVFVDDVYLSRVGPSTFDLMDIERVEVLRGPQGTLFGRNTTAGAISIVTKGPTFDAENAVEAAIGDYGLREGKASISGPLRGNTLAGRASVSAVRRDGFMYNVTTGEAVQDTDNVAARGQLLFAPTGTLGVRVVGDYARQESNCCTQVSRGVFETLDNGTPVPNNILARVDRAGHELLPPTPFARNVEADSPLQANMDQHALAVQVRWALADHELTSITARRDWDWDPLNDGEDTGIPAVTRLGQGNRQEQTSQEVRVASRGDRRIDYIAGLYYFEERVDGTADIGLGPAAADWFFPPTAPQPRAVIAAAVDGFAVQLLSTSESRSNAVFGNAVWHIGGAFDVSAGLRFTSETRDGQFDLHQIGPSLASLSPSDAATAQAVRNSFGSVKSYALETDGDDLSGALTVTHRTRFGTSYMTVADGYKSGGLNLGDFTTDIDLIVKPEDVDHLEIGTKNRLLDSVFVNVAVYRTKVANYQTSVTTPNAIGRPTQYISNTEEALSQGFEVDVAWSPDPRFALSAGVAYADATYESFRTAPCPPEVSVVPAQCDLSGEPIAGSPRRSWSLALDGVQPVAGALELFWRFDYSHRSDMLMSVTNSRYSRVDDRDLANLGIGVRGVNRRWDLMFWVRNVFDEDYFNVVQVRTTGWLVGLPGDPRTSGFTYKGRF